MLLFSETRLLTPTEIKYGLGLPVDLEQPAKVVSFLAVCMITFIHTTAFSLSAFFITDFVEN